MDAIRNVPRRELLSLLEEQEPMRAHAATLRAAAAGDPIDVAAAIGHWQRLWRGGLARHCLDEEARLVVWLPGSPELTRLHADHGALRRLSAELERTPTSATLLALLGVLVSHLDWERDCLLPALIAAMDADA